MSHGNARLSTLDKVDAGVVLPCSNLTQLLEEK
jgi:hypothetical protein